MTTLIIRVGNEIILKLWSQRMHTKILLFFFWIAGSIIVDCYKVCAMFSRSDRSRCRYGQRYDHFSQIRKWLKARGKTTWVYIQIVRRKKCCWLDFVAMLSLLKWGGGGHKRWLQEKLVQMPHYCRQSYLHFATLLVGCLEVQVQWQIG